MNGRPPRPRLRRGQPLVALALLLTAWVGARAMLYEDAAPPPQQQQLPPQPRYAAVAAPARPLAAPASPVQVPHAADRPVPAPERPFVAAPQPAPDFERLRLAEGHQILWQEAVAPQQDPASAPAEGAAGDVAPE